MVMLLAALKFACKWSHEHPWSAYSWFCPWWAIFFAKAGTAKFKTSMCSFGMPWRKDMGLASANADYLAGVARPCEHGIGYRHAERVVGAAAANSGEYSDLFCADWARQARICYDADPHVLARLTPTMRRSSVGESTR